MNVTTFDAMPSRTPLSKRRTALRTDPYCRAHARTPLGRFATGAGKGER